MREVMNAILHVLATGCQWRALPKDFPPRSTVYAYFWEWRRYGALDRIHHAHHAAPPRKPFDNSINFRVRL